MVELKNDTCIEYVISLKSKGVYNSELKALLRRFLTSVNNFWNKIGIQFHNTPLVIEQNNYASRIVDVHIVYDLDNWPKFYTKKLFVWSDYCSKK